jgi:ABC-type transport system involved in multi-copper enzyme maturation permease subunit
LLVLAALAISVASTFGGGAYLHTFMTNASVPVALLVPLVGLLLMSGEFSTRTLLVTFSLMPVRGRVVAAKSVAAILVAVALTVVSALLAVAAAGALSLTGESVR